MPTVTWPSVIPCERHPHDYWLWPDVRDWFKLLLGSRTAAYVELGTWCGASARLAAELAPNARIWCVDCWDGRGGLQYHEHAIDSLQLCQANLWPYRDRVTLLRETTLDGVQWLAGHGVRPDVVYVDADHSFNAAKADMLACRAAWPGAVICGDDYNEPPGAAAVDVFGAGRVHAGYAGKFWVWANGEGYQAAMSHLSRVHTGAVPVRQPPG